MIDRVLKPSRPLHACLTIAASVLTLSGDVLAQDLVPPRSLRGQLFDFGVRISVVQGVPTSPVSADQTNLIAGLTSLEVATAPLGTSTGGFTYRFDPEGGTFQRSTDSFGPSFASRSLTSGKGKVSIGANFLHAKYNSIGGSDMRKGDLRLARNAKDVPFPFAFGYGSARIDLSSDTAVAFVNYGLTNDIDVGLAVPWVRVAVGVDFAIFTPDNVDVTPGGHSFLLPTASAAGLGDIAVTAKYRMWRYREGGLASELDIRLPSGNKNQLRGTGVTRTLLSLIYSHGGKVSPHINVGYELWSSAVPLTEDGGVVVKNRITYAFGFEFQPHPRTTLLIDVIGRHQLKGGQVEYRTVSIGSGTVEALLPASKGLHIVSAVPGIKWNVAGNVLLTANLLTAISSVGLRANIIPVVGLDWAF